MESLVFSPVSVSGIIYAEPSNCCMAMPGERLPLFYLHGEAERLNGFDICNADEEAAYTAAKPGWCLVEIEFMNSQDEPRIGIMFSYMGSMNRMEGRICLVDDIEAIQQVLTGGEYKLFGCKNYEDLVYLGKEHPKALLAIYEPQKDTH